MNFGTSSWFWEPPKHAAGVRSKGGLVCGDGTLWFYSCPKLLTKSVLKIYINSEKQDQKKKKNTPRRDTYLIL